MKFKRIILRTIAIAVICFTASALFLTKVSAGSFLSDFSPKGVVAFFASTAKQESPNPQTVLAPCVGGEKTWDGEGATNNWSEAANWTCDQVPAVTDNVKFDATSTKDAIVNVPTVALELQVAATYSGTISIANGVSLLIGRSAGNGRQTATQAGGNIICGSGSTLTVSRTNFTQTGGTLDCSAGAVTTSFATITMNGGIFNAPSGTLTLSGSTLSIGASGTFNHNGGTIVSRDDNALLGIPQPLVINNLISESQTSQNLTDSTVRILGDLTLNSGGVITGAQRTNWELHGNITVANGAPTVSRLNTFITIAGTNDQTFINSGGLNPTATWRINKPGGQFILQSDLTDFGSLDLVNGKINAGNFTVNVGTGNATGGNANSYVIGKLRTQFRNFGVTNNYPIGTANGYSPATASFSPNGSTITIEAKQGAHPSMNAATSLSRYWTVSRTGDATANMTFTYLDGDVNGDENLYATARINNGTAFLSPVTAPTNLISVTGETLFGDFTAGATLAPCVAGFKTWDGEGATNNWSEALNWSCNAVPLTTDRVIFNAASQKNATIDTNATVRSIEIDGYNGIVTNASTVFTIQENSSLGLFKQTSGTFNGGSGTLNFNLGGSAANSGLRLTGGTFISTSGTFNLDSFAGSVIDSGATFQHNNGTVVILGVMNNGTNIGGTATSIAFNNLDIRANTNLNATLAAYARTVTTNGTLTSGGNFGFGGAVVRALGNVVVAANSVGGINDLEFAGTATQTFTNLGGVYPFRNLTVNKPSGTVTANSPLALDSTLEDLTVTSGTLYLAANANITARNIVVSSGGRLVNDSSLRITVGTSVTNNGIIDLQGGGAACDETPGTDPILIESSNTTQKPWNGNGANRFVDVSVSRMGGTGTKTVFSGTNVTGNNATWLFNTSCPTALSISPTAVNIQTGTTQTFTAGGGFAPYTFSIPTNNSGANIDPVSGVYVAGTVSGATDTVRVSDPFGNTADATVSLFGSAVAVRFGTSPQNITAGNTFAPIEARVEDASGHVVLDYNAPLTISLIAANGATLSGTLTKNAVNGIATFDDLSMTREGQYRMRLDSGTLLGSLSVFFDVISGPSSNLRFDVQPSNAYENVVITPAIKVTVTDAFGNRKYEDGRPIRLSLGNSAGATLAGIRQVGTVAGTSTFSDLSINRIGNGYTLIATGFGLTSGTSEAFNIVPLLVTNTNDSGAGSLRQAILDSNALSGTQTIQFNIPGNVPHKIVPLTLLPSIQDSAIIDATTQPGYADSPIIELSGEAIGNNGIGLHLSYFNSAIRGFVLNRWRTAGIQLSTSNNSVSNCFIGTDITGTTALPNGDGIQVNSFPVSIDDNLISGNNINGITVRINNTTNAVTFIRRNLIGTQIDGISPLGNQESGIVIGSSTNPVRIEIGGEQNEANTIAFNSENGIKHLSSNNFVKIRRNKIFDNGSLLHPNALGIDLANPHIGLDFNDPLDADLGSNGRQNYPKITSVVSSNGQTTIIGTLNSKPNTSYGIDLFVNSHCANGQAEVYLDTKTGVTTDSSGIAQFTKVINQPIQNGRRITATAFTDNGFEETSEISPCSLGDDNVVVAASYAISGQINDTGNSPLSGVRVNVQGSSISTVTDANGNYTLRDLPNGFDYTIVPSAPNYVFAPTNRTVTNLQSDQTGQDFVGTRLSNISGQVMSISNGSTFPLSNATVTVTGVGSVTTDNNGRYRVNNLTPATYTVNAAKPNFGFTPATVNTNVNGDQVVNFVGQIFNINNLQGRIITDGFGLPVRNADGSAYMQLNAASFRWKGKFSYDGRRIAYVIQYNGFSGNQFKRLAVSNFDLTGEVEIGEAALGNNINETDPVWSPAGDKIAYVKYESGSWSLMMLNPDGTNRQSIYALPFSVNRVERGIFDPHFAPTGDKIVFTVRTGSLDEIYSIKTNGTELTRLTTGNRDGHPQFSPDGSKILFIREAGEYLVGKIFTMNTSGGNVTEIPTPQSNRTFAAAWSPDGAAIVFKEGDELKAMLANGSSPVTIGTENYARSLQWVVNPATSVVPGANVTANFGSVNLSFAGINSAGNVTVTPIPAASAGTMPAGFAVAPLEGIVSQAFEITSSANVTSPITVCFTIPGTPSLVTFNRYSILHNENGVLIDRTVSRDFATKQVCAQTTSLSPFVLGEQIDSGLPSITGLVVDPSGNPMSGVSVELTGTENGTTLTDSDGRFAFVNLTPNGNYNVSPKQLGVLFNEYNQDFINVTGEKTVLFTGTAQNFTVSGKLTDASGNALTNTRVYLTGVVEQEETTDASGNYSFTGLPADGFFNVQPFSTVGTFSPESRDVSPLTGDATGVDFSINLSPTASDSFISGRVRTSNGFGIRNATVEISGGNLSSPRRVQTGSFGNFAFDSLRVGETYVITVISKRFNFANSSRVITLSGDFTDADFTADSEN